MGAMFPSHNCVLLTWFHSSSVSTCIVHWLERLLQDYYIVYRFHPCIEPDRYIIKVDETWIVGLSLRNGRARDAGPCGYVCAVTPMTAPREP
jgi:hypothetical protein